MKREGLGLGFGLGLGLGLGLGFQVRVGVRIRVRVGVRVRVRAVEMGRDEGALRKYTHHRMSQIQFTVFFGLDIFPFKLVSAPTISPFSVSRKETTQKK
jgi:hypothetical protein